MSKIEPHYSEKRSLLADVIPLDMPYSIQVEASQVCNLKCSYCMQSFVPDHGREIMSMTTFARLCGRIMEFDGKPKTVNFAGWGEPLCNPALPYMIRHLKECDITENIAIITNGLLLNKEKSWDLISAGVDHIRISLQGITEEAYWKISGKNMSFPLFLDNLTTLYRFKRNCQISVKVADIALGYGEEDAFYKMFEGICDRMYVEKIRPMFSENMQDGRMMSKYGNEHPPVIACPLPFYMMAVTATGDILPCCAYEDPTHFGNIKDTSLKGIWHDFENNLFWQMRDFQKMHLSGCRKEQDDYPVCQGCLMPDAILTPGDELDKRAEEIRGRI